MPRKREEPLPGRAIAELFAYREFLLFLIWRDIRVRYRHVSLGVAWIVAQPLAITAIIVLLFSRVSAVSGDERAYPVFAYVGVWLWTFFASAVVSASTSVVSNASLITKVYFPRIIVPLAAIGARVVDLAAGAPVLLVLMAVYGVPCRVRLLLLPGVLVLCAVFALGIGVLLATAMVRFRDIGQIVPFLLQLWFFATPVLYSPDLLSGVWTTWLLVNPVAGLIEAARHTVFGGLPDHARLLATVAMALGVAVFGTMVFNRNARRFADEV